MQLLKQSTAATLVLGPFVDDTDGKTAETALTISQADVRLSKAGGAFAQKNESSAATHMENGYYSVALDATDTNTLGRLTVCVSEAGALPVWRAFMVLPAVVYDSLVAGSDNLQTHAVEISNNLITNAAIADNTITASKIAAAAISAVKFDTNALSSQNVFNVVGDVQGKVLGGGFNNPTANGVWADVRAISDGLITAAKAPNLDAAITSRAAAATALSNATWTNARAASLDNLDATISSRATPTQVNAEVDQALVDVGLTTVVTGRIDAAVSSRAVPGDEMDLIDAPNIAARDAIAVTVESHLLDEGDSQMLINAIVEAIGNVNVDEVALVAAIRADLERTGGDLDTLTNRLTAQRATNLDNLDAAISSRMATFALPTNFAALGINVSGHVSRVTLVDTTTVNSDMRGTDNALLAASYVAPDNAGITDANSGIDSALAELVAVRERTDNLPDNPAATGDAMALVDGAISALVLAADACNKLADHMRRRTQANVEASADGDALSLGSLYGFIQQAQESSASGGVLTVKRTDGTTTLGTKNLTSDANAEPITSVS